MCEDLVVTIIPNWNLKNDLGECLDSLLLSSYSNLQIVVIDNGSTDGSVDFIKQSYPQVCLISLPENIGFAGAVNIGINWALEQGAKYYFVLNNDTIVSSDAISKVIDVMNSNNKIGIAAPKIINNHEPYRIYSLGTRTYKYLPLPISIGKNQTDKKKYSKIMEFDYVTGTAMMISRPCVEKTGLFNTNYFMYYEDSEYCRRAQDNGFSIICVGNAIINHKGAVSASKNLIHIVNIRARNRFLFYRRFSHGPNSRLTHLSIWLIAIWKIFSFIVKRKSFLIKPYLSGLWQGYKEPL